MLRKFSYHNLCIFLMCDLYFLKSTYCVSIYVDLLAWIFVDVFCIFINGHIIPILILYFVDVYFICICCHCIFILISYFCWCALYIYLLLQYSYPYVCIATVFLSLFCIFVDMFCIFICCCSIPILVFSVSVLWIRILGPILLL